MGLEHCSRFMNKYFLLIAILQLWPLITPVSPVSTWGPLITIFAVSASKEAWDDYSRYCLDKQFNEKSVWVVKTGVKTRVCHCPCPGVISSCSQVISNFLDMRKPTSNELASLSCSILF